MREYVLAFVQKELRKVWWGKYVDVGMIYTALLSALRGDAHKGQTDPLEELRLATPESLARLLLRDVIEKTHEIAMKANVESAGIALPGNGNRRSNRPH